MTECSLPAASRLFTTSRGLYAACQNGLVEDHSGGYRIEPLRLLGRGVISCLLHALVLDCTNYCTDGLSYFADGYGPGLVSGLMRLNPPIEIPYERLATHLDPNGPYRHILNN